jgi:hypothetical protein
VIVAAVICFAVRNKSKNDISATDSLGSHHGTDSPDMHYPFMQVKKIVFGALVEFKDS